MPGPGTPLPGPEPAWNRQSVQVPNPARRLRACALPSETLLPAAAVLVQALAGYVTGSALVLWSAFVPALWLAFACPARLVALLLITTPVFPVVRLATDALEAQRVSSKGLFLSADDPLVAALIVAWLWRMLRYRERPRLFPISAACLLALYPLVILANSFRMEQNQTLVSFLYYLKWGEYAVLLLLIPLALSSAQVLGLLGSLRKLVLGVILASTAFAAYEVLEATRTHSYTAAARFPRASSFFGSLDPKRFGASEDPANFGVYAMVAGAVLLGLVSRSSRPQLGPLAGVAASAVALLLSVSRAPMLAAAMAFIKINRIRSTRLFLVLGTLLITVVASQFLAPQLWSTTLGRFAAVLDWEDAVERSAVNRLTVALNSPFFEIDQYWLVGHGASSYRFIAEEHLAGITGGSSRSLYNFVLTAWYDAGLIGVVLWLMLFVQLNRRLLAISLSSALEEVRGLAWGLRGALWGLATASLFGEVPYNWRVMGYFYACCGICLAADRFWRLRPGPMQASAG